MNDEAAYFVYLGWVLVIMLIVAVLMCISGRDTTELGTTALMVCAIIATTLVVSHMFPDVALEAITPSLGLVPDYTGVGT